MIRTGSKFLYGLSAFGLVAAVLYAAATGDHAVGMDALLGPLTLGYKGYVGDHVGYSVLIGLSAASLALGAFLSAVHDADPQAAAGSAGLEAVPETPAPVNVNYWPVVGAFSAGSVVLGLAVHSSLFVIGMIGLSITLVEWAVSAWADRATGDPEVNREIRHRFMNPIEVPVASVLGIGVFVLAVSRILLALPKVGGYLVFGLVPVAIFAVGALIVLKPQISQSVIAAILVVGGVALLAGGVAAAIAGERHVEPSEEPGEHGEGEEGLAPLPPPGRLVIEVGN